MPRFKQGRLIASEVCQLDPLNCNSVISFSIYRRRNGGVGGEIALTDCNRVIEWYFSNDREGGEKIGRAVAILQRFQEIFCKSIRSSKRRK